MGRRSADGGPVLREAVRRLLADELRVLPSAPGGGAARPARPGAAWRGGDNPGRIVVSGLELEAWLARRAVQEKG